MRNLTMREIEYDSQRPNYIKDALKLSEEINYDYGIVLSTIWSVGDMNREVWEDVHESLLKAKEICEQKGFMLLLGRVYSQLANLYWAKHDFETRFRYLKKANQIYMKIDAKKM